MAALDVLMGDVYQSEVGSEQQESFAAHSAANGDGERVTGDGKCGARSVGAPRVLASKMRLL